MHTAVTRVTGRRHILDATGHHPYARLATGGLGDIRGFMTDAVTGWLTRRGPHPTFSAIGDGEAAARLLRDLAEARELTGVRRVHLPRVQYATLATLFAVDHPEDWEFRWTKAPPPQQPGQERVVALRSTDEPAVAELLQIAFPTAFTRPGDPRVRAWYGIRERDRLVACGADRSRGGVGSIGALAVHPDHQGRGLGAALTAAMATALCREFDTVTLGVMVDNHRASALYRRLGFIDATGRTSVDLPRRWS